MTEGCIWAGGSPAFVHFKLCGSGFGNRRRAAEFLGSETLRYAVIPDSRCRIQDPSLKDAYEEGLCDNLPMAAVAATFRSPSCYMFRAEARRYFSSVGGLIPNSGFQTND